MINDDFLEELMESEEQEENMTEEELKNIYGEIPENIENLPGEHSLNDAIEGTLEEDKDVIFNEISE